MDLSGRKGVARGNGRTLSAVRPERTLSGRDGQGLATADDSGFGRRAMGRGGQVYAMETTGKANTSKDEPKNASRECRTW